MVQAMESLNPSVGQQIAQAAIAFQQQRTGHEPQLVVVVLNRRHGAVLPRWLNRGGRPRMEQGHRMKGDETNG